MASDGTQNLPSTLRLYDSCQFDGVSALLIGPLGASLSSSVILCDYTNDTQLRLALRNSLIRPRFTDSHTR